MDFKFKVIGTDRLKNALAKGDSEIIKESHQAMQKALQLISRAVSINVSGSHLKVRSGRLRSSIKILRVIASPKHIAGIVEIGGQGRGALRVRYARIQEYGGTVRGKNGRSLAIPMRAAKTNAGVARFSARELISNPGSFGYDRTFFSKAKKMIFGVKGKLSTPLFLLRESVTIRAKHFARDAFDKTILPALKLFDSHTDIAIRRAGL